VFILAGQSNMEGHAHVRTLDAVGMDSATAPLLKEMQDHDGTPRVCERVWIASLGSGNQERVGKLTVGFGAAGGGPKIGPEFTFGIFMEKFVDGPILIIKTAWGGKSLHTDFRPPSAGPYVFNEQQLEALRRAGRNIAEVKAQKDAQTGVYYRLMVGYVKRVLADIGRIVPDYDPRAGYEIAGFVWFQGWNDMVDSGTYPNRGKAGGYDLYTRLLCDLIRDVRRDLGVPDLPFVIGVMGVGGPLDLSRPDRYTPIHHSFRQAMAAPAEMPEFRGTVAAVWTERYWDTELHELLKRKDQLKAKAAELEKDSSLTKDQRKEMLKKFEDELYTPRERELLTGASNAEFHYMGSGKVMAQIGKAFAEAMMELMQKRKELAQ